MCSQADLLCAQRWRNARLHGSKQAKPDAMNSRQLCATEMAYGQTPCMVPKSKHSHELQTAARNSTNTLRKLIFT